MTEMFLPLDEAVKIAVREYGVEPEIARQDFEQKCFIRDTQYDIGYRDALCDTADMIKEILKSK